MLILEMFMTKSHNHQHCQQLQLKNPKIIKEKGYGGRTMDIKAETFMNIQLMKHLLKQLIKKDEGSYGEHKAYLKN